MLSKRSPSSPSERGAIENTKIEKPAIASSCLNTRILEILLPRRRHSNVRHPILQSQNPCSVDNVGPRIRLPQPEPVAAAVVDMEFRRHARFLQGQIKSGECG